jgi:hypothetical protein
MKKFIIALAATTALSVAAPAVAQNYGGQNYGGQNYGQQNYGGQNNGGNLQLRIDQLRMELQAGVQSGDISRPEAMRLRQQLRELSLLERQYAVNGISGRERAELQHRINTLRQGIRMASRDSNRRYDRDDDRYDRDDNRYGRAGDSRYDRNRDGWDDRDGRYDVDSRYDANRDRYDDRDRNRDGRWDDDRYDRGDVRTDRDRGIFGQMIDSVTGRGGLRVGQQASGNLQALPYAYRSQFRDGNGVYYRTDGRQIYQIDARNHVIARIFTMNR